MQYTYTRLCAHSMRIQHAHTAHLSLFMWSSQPGSVFVSVSMSVVDLQNAHRREVQYTCDTRHVINLCQTHMAQESTWQRRAHLSSPSGQGPPCS